MSILTTLMKIMNNVSNHTPAIIIDNVKADFWLSLTRRCESGCFFHRYWQHLLSAVGRAKFMRHMLLQNSWALEWTFKNTYLWQNISPLLPGHAGRGVELVGLDGDNVVVVAQVSGGGRHAKVIPRWQPHPLCEKQVIIGLCQCSFAIVYKPYVCVS